MRITRNLAAAAALAVLPATAPAQDGRCGGGRGVTIPDLGWRGIECAHCSISYYPAGAAYRFSTEPRLRGVTGRGEGRLRDGDVLAAVDGRLITTPEGAQRLAEVRDGQRVRLTVRRGGRTQDVDVTAGSRCVVPPVPPVPPTAKRAPGAPYPPRPGVYGGIPQPPEPPEPPQAPQAPQAPRAPQVPHPPQPPLPPPPPDILPEGWFGFGISCDRCGIRKHDDDVRMFFDEAPTVENVERGSPADRAGIRRGDRLVMVDGISLTTPQGGQRFATIRPGEAVTWTVLRGSQRLSARATALRRPDVDTRRWTPAAVRAEAGQLRFSGVVGRTNVEVRGAPVTIFRDERTGETVIRSHDLTVRLHPDQR